MPDQERDKGTVLTELADIDELLDADADLDADAVRTIYAECQEELRLLKAEIDSTQTAALR